LFRVRKFPISNLQFQIFGVAHLLDLLLLAVVWVGHAAIWTVSLNIAYSRPWHKRYLRAYRLLMAVVISVIPVYLVFQFPVAELVDHWYSWVCLAIGGVIVPLITLQRLLKRQPRQVIDESSVIVDMQKQLGEIPSDGGKRKRQSQLPLNRVFQVEFTKLTLRLPNLPAEWDGLTILQLSDLHFIGTPSQAYYHAVIERCMSDGVPDILAITGDIIDSDTHHEWVQPILGRLRWNIAAFAILGNHDWWYHDELVRQELRQLNMDVLNNCWKVIDVRGHPLIAIGHEGPWYRPAPDVSEAPPGFQLLLSHTPDNIGWARRHRVQLMLSGHNHGGQIRIPGFGSIFVPSMYSRRYDMGNFDEGDTFLHVNRGLGGKSPLRYFCRPQVTRIVLQSV